MNHTDTIAAAATAMGSAGIGIIRISGTDAFAVLEKVFRPKNEKKVMSEQPGYTVHYGMAVDGEQVLDEVLVMLMRGPHSYTAEDTAEIDCHGGRLVMQKILEAVLKNGARAAEPGEFTKRAFLNGRMDLSQAEAVMDLIQSKNEMALKSSLPSLRETCGRRSRSCGHRFYMRWPLWKQRWMIRSISAWMGTARSFWKKCGELPQKWRGC